MIETFDVNITGADMDGSISQFQKLLRLLVLAGAYWMSDYQIGAGAFVKPVWIEAHSDCETETRYAYIYDGTIPSLSNPYEFPYRSGVTETLPVIIEHGVWRSTPPGQDECMKTYSYVTGPGEAAQVFYPAENSDTVDANLDTSVLTTNSLQSITDEFVPGKNLGMRFTNITIPPGATITNAFLKVVSNYNTLPGETAAASSDVYGELNANPATYTTFANFTGRALTVATSNIIDWSAPTTAGQIIYSNDLSAIIQEIIDLPGWASGNAIALQVDSPAVGFPYSREFAAFNDPTYDMPELHIAYANMDVYGINIPVCLNNFAAGYNVNAQIEHVAVYDASTGLYSANLISTQPSGLFPNPLGVGDRLFIGSSYPFSNFEFDLQSAGNGTVTYIYKYSTAGGVAAGTIANFVEAPFGLFSGVGNTGFTAGVFDRPSNWAKNQVVGVPGLPNLYWIAIEITVITVAPAVVPVQITKPIYTTSWPFWEVAEDEVSGDINALLKFLLIQINTLGGATSGIYNNVLYGLRHYDRGADYTPYLNVQANHADVSFTAGGIATTPDNSLAPSGKSLNYSVGVATAETSIGKWVLTTSSMVQQYYGKYRAFVRARITAGAAGVAGFRLQFIEQLGAKVLLETPIRYSTTTTIPGYDLIDLGYISFNAAGGIPYSQVGINLRAITTGASTFDVLDIVLFPVDEATLEYKTSDSAAYFLYTTATDYQQPLHDSTKPKEGAYTGMVDENNALQYTMNTKTLGLFSIPNKTQMRIFFLPWSDMAGRLKGTESLFDIQFRKVEQFLNLRGSA